jgi:hypothetical protein
LDWNPLGLEPIPFTAESVVFFTNLSPFGLESILLVAKAWYSLFVLAPFGLEPIPLATESVVFFTYYYCRNQFHWQQKALSSLLIPAPFGLEQIPSTVESVVFVTYSCSISVVTNYIKSRKRGLLY